MSIPTPVQIGQPSMWSSLAPYLAPPLAASGAIIPAYYGFVAKSAQQLGKPIPKMPVLQVVKDSFKAAPTIGIIVGTQMVAQKLVETGLEKALGNKNKKPSFSTMLISSMTVGLASAPALAIFNGQTMGRTIKESLSGLTKKQTAAIVLKETSFLFSVRITGPVSEAMKRVFGESEAVKYGSAFVSGAIGSIIGHPADTALTRWQKGLKIDSFRQSMNGVFTKAIALGIFSTCYEFGKKNLQSTKH